MDRSRYWCKDQRQNEDQHQQALKKKCNYSSIKQESQKFHIKLQVVFPITPLASAFLCQLIATLETVHSWGCRGRGQRGKRPLEPQQWPAHKAHAWLHCNFMLQQPCRSKNSGEEMCFILGCNWAMVMPIKVVISRPAELRFTHVPLQSWGWAHLTNTFTNKDI